MAPRGFEDGRYWVQVSADSEPEVALLEQGCWRTCSSGAAIATGELYRIGRRARAPADAFEEELERDGDLGV